MKAYLDIETTYDRGISVVGIHVPERPLIQLLSGNVTDVKIADALEGVDTVVTFNGSRFDLPIIRRVSGLEIAEICGHRDLLSICRKRGLKGGLKRIECRLGIPRVSEVIDGVVAPYLWQRYEEMADYKALEALLAYNREDVLNLRILEEILDGNRFANGDGIG